MSPTPPRGTLPFPPFPVLRMHQAFSHFRILAPAVLSAELLGTPQPPPLPPLPGHLHPKQEYKWTWPRPSPPPGPVLSYTVRGLCICEDTPDHRSTRHHKPASPWPLPGLAMWALAEHSAVRWMDLEKRLGCLSRKYQGPRYLEMERNLFKGLAQRGCREPHGKPK